MAPLIDSHHKLGPQIRRAAGERLDSALQVLRDPLEEAAVQDEAVHTTRKRVKEVRALLRLVRDEVGSKTFARENRALRDASRPLSEVRDAVAVLEAFDALQSALPQALSPEAIDGVRASLCARRDDVRRRALTDEQALAKAAEAMTQVRSDVDRWGVQHRSWKGLRRGMHRAYAKAKRAMDAASVKETDARLHEWRKRTKDLRYQLELIEPIWPNMMKALADEAHELTDLLGDDHDLAVLSAELDDDEHAHLETLEALHEAIARRRSELQAAAAALGARLFAEDPMEFTQRIEAWWKATATLEAPRASAS